MLAHILSEYAPVYARQVINTRELFEADLQAVERFLAEDPLRTVIMRSLIQDNGLFHSHNRGRFYGYFQNGCLAGVALLGHATMMYARPEVEIDALAYFAKIMVEHNIACNVVFGPKSTVETFSHYVTSLGRKIKLVRNMRMYACHQARVGISQMQLIRANANELDVCADAHAQMFVDATGVDPRQKDPQGFRERVAQRIENKRTWIKVQNNEVVFKAELQSVTSEVVYIEGVWTKEEARNQGIAKSCMAELTHRLLRQHKMISLCVDDDEEIPRRIYEQIGFDYVQEFQACYLAPIQ